MGGGEFNPWLSGCRLSSRAEILFAAPSKGQGESWHQVLSRASGRLQGNLAEGEWGALTPWASSCWCFMHPGKFHI